MIAVLSSTNQSPLGLAASAGLAANIRASAQLNLAVIPPAPISARRQLAVSLEHLATLLAELRRMADETVDEDVLVVPLKPLAVFCHVGAAGRLFLRRARE